MKIHKNYPFNLFKGITIVPFLFLVLIIASCRTPRNLVYFSNLPSEGDTSQIANRLSAKIEKGDILGVTVTTLSPEFNQLFNSGSIPQSLVLTQGTTPNTVNSANNNTFSATREGFLVDENGQINLPVLGKMDVINLTRKEAQDKITAEIAKTTKDPIVNVKFLNYKVTVIGEVTRPGSFTVPDERINVLEALGMAGDMTPFSVRDNVLIIREKGGARSMQRINLNDKEVFKSPYFYLQQNDVVYVQPENKLKAQQASSGDFRIWSLVLSAISVLSVSIYYLTR